MDRELNKLGQSDIYAIVCELLFTVKDNKDYCTMSELAYLLDKNSFIHLIQYFGGCTIKIPTVDEFRSTIKIMLLHQYFTVEGNDWLASLEKAGFEKSETRSAQKKLVQFNNVLKDIKLGRNYECIKE